MHGLYRWQAEENGRAVEWAKVQYDTGVGPMRRSQYEDGGIKPDFDELPTREEFEGRTDA